MIRKLIAYSLSIGLIIVVTLIKYNVHGLGAHTPTLMYHLAIIVVAVFLGTGPAVLALILAGGAIDYIFVHPSYYPNYHWAGLLGTLVFFVDGAVIIWLIARLRDAEGRLLQRNRSLKSSNDRMTLILSRALDDSPNRHRADDDMR